MNLGCCCCSVLSCFQLFVTPWTTAACQAPLSTTISLSLLKFMSIELMILSSHLILCLSLFLLPSVFPNIKVFSNELAFRIRPNYWFQLQHQSFQWYSGLISFRTDWFDLLAVLGTLKNVLWHHSLTASILQRSAFVMVHLSHLYMTLEKP